MQTITTATPKVSVVCPFFNAEKYFAEAIDSVLAQSFTNFELILADDGSRDSSTAIADRYAALDPRVRRIEHPEHANRGVCATRNLAIAEARGEFIAFLDADDFWEPHKLAEQLAVLAAHPDVALVAGSTRYWRSWSGGVDELILSGPAWDRPVAPQELILTIYPLGAAPAPCPSDLLMRAEAVRAVEGFEVEFTGKLQLYEDQCFLTKVYLRYPVYFDSRCWLWYRQHEESCVAEVHRGGLYDDVRLHFLNWLEAYLARRPELDGPEVRRGLRRALEKYRQPALYAVRQTARRVKRLAVRVAGRA